MEKQRDGKQVQMRNEQKKEQSALQALRAKIMAAKQEFFETLVQGKSRKVSKHAKGSPRIYLSTTARKRRNKELKRRRKQKWSLKAARSRHGKA